MITTKQVRKLFAAICKDVDKEIIDSIKFEIKRFKKGYIIKPKGTK